MERRSKYEVQTILREIRQQFKDGKTFSDVKQYLVDTYNYAPHTAENMISEARKVIKEYYKKDAEYFAEDFYSKYNYLYQKSLKTDNIRAAKDILDSMVKLTGAGDFNKQKVEFDGTQPVNITFGFNNKEESDE